MKADEPNEAQTRSDAEFFALLDKIAEEAKRNGLTPDILQQILDEPATTVD